MSYYPYQFGSWTIPTMDRIARDRQSFRVASARAFRVDGAISSYGTERPPMEAKDLQLPPFLIYAANETAAETAKQAMMTTLMGGTQKLLFSSPSASAISPPTFCYAYVKDIDIEYLNLITMKVNLTFHIDSPILWQDLAGAIDSYFDSSPSEVTIASNVFGETWDERTFAFVTISTSPKTITITGWPGNLRTQRVIMRLEHLGGVGFKSPKIHNTTVGVDEYIQYNADSINTSTVLQINAHSGAVRRSEDGGASFVNTPTLGDVYTACDLNPSQWPLFTLKPGNNTIVVTQTGGGTPNYRLGFLALPAWGL